MRKPLRILVHALCLAALMLPAPAARVAFAQEERFEVAQQQPRQRRSLFEALFGSDNQQAAPQQRQQQNQQTRAPQPRAQQARPAAPARPAATAPAPRTATPAPAATAAAAQKSESATRIAVFGDSQAIDLARALERLYADDPETLILSEGVGSSGLVRDDFFDWNRAVEEAIAADRFDIAVVKIGINDRQALEGHAPLTEGWRRAYSARLDRLLGALRSHGKPVVWVELPPMSQQRFSQEIAQISALQRAAVTAAGGEWVETYERFLSEAGTYSATGPDLSGQIVPMRKGDGIHLSAAGADKLAFYVDRAMRPHHDGGRISADVADPLAGTDAAEMMRPPFQGLGQERHFAVAGAIQQLSGAAQRASDLLIADRGGFGPAAGPAGRLDLYDLVNAPAGRADAFGVGFLPEVGD